MSYALPRGSGPSMELGGMYGISFTATAHQALQRAIASRPANLVRLTALGGGPGGWSFGLALTKAPLATDAVWDEPGLKVCADKASLEWLADLCIDYAGPAGDEAFVFSHRPTPGEQP